MPIWKAPFLAAFAGMTNENLFGGARFTPERYFRMKTSKKLFT